MQVGFIGIGRMGQAMARRLLDAGHGLAVYNRSAQKTRALTDAGARVTVVAPDIEPGFADLPVTLRQRRFGHQKSTGDLGSAQPANRAQGERDLRRCR